MPAGRSNRQGRPWRLFAPAVVNAGRPSAPAAIGAGAVPTRLALEGLAIEGTGSFGPGQATYLLLAWRVVR